MSVNLTESAANQIKKQLTQRGKGVGLLLGVKKSGCSGYAYQIDFADEITESDSVFENHGVKIVVNNDNLEFLDGVQLDYRKEGINEAFCFDNPNVTAMCGCGESFAV
ncbi:MAG: iron-sulfur cluster assembly accessory protein [Methylococcales bacterium]